MKNKIYFVPLYYYLTYPDYKRYCNNNIMDKYDLKLLNVTYNDLNLPYLNDKSINKDIDNVFNFNIAQKKLAILKKISYIKNFIKTQKNIINFIFTYIIIISFYNEDLNNFFNFLYLVLIYISSFFIYKILLKFKERDKFVKDKRTYNCIYKYLKKVKPKILIFSSDLGDKNIRLTILAAENSNIPTAIYWMGDIEVSRNLNCKYDSDLNLINAIKFDDVQNNIIGSYSKRARIFVSNTIAKEKLIKSGINEERIKVIKFKPFLNMDINAFRNIKMEKYIVYYTENLNSIFGEKYINDLHIFLNSIFQNFHQSFGLNFIIRPHPMEREETDSFNKLKKIFTGKGIIIDYEEPLEILALNAELNIGHFSKVLLDTVLSEGNILSLNLITDTNINNSFIPNNEYMLLKASSYKEINDVINYFTIDNNFKSKYFREQEKLRQYLTNDASDFDVELEYIIKEFEVNTK